MHMYSGAMKTEIFGHSHHSAIWFTCNLSLKQADLMGIDIGTDVLDLRASPNNKVLRGSKRSCVFGCFLPEQASAQHTRNSIFPFRSPIRRPDCLELPLLVVVVRRLITQAQSALPPPKKVKPSSL
jgi:hypothetical protein